MIETVETTGSTNADLIDRLSNGEAIEEGYWLRAERQTGGRGRLGRKWESPSGNLFCSTVIDVRDGDPAPHSLSFVVGLAAYDMLERSLLPRTPIMLKWPNDVLVGGAKIAGILLERAENKVVAGVGVNVCRAPELPDRETTSIVYENGKHGGSAELVLSLLADALKQRISNWRAFGLTATLDAWTVAAHPIGTNLTVKPAPDEEIHGAFAGLDEQGAMLLRLANGAMRTIHAGDVSMIAEG
uniref:biotin--[acetyl-CoA-carboxylase] ligase n=1 Tax=uncultured Erythrobacter sp. TaxID=263913 RepID=UPI0026239B5A|nr:biotin--[acetyl-CoA-carboxylase] ligase [uncultured Erythrobacter sp.]